MKANAVEDAYSLLCFPPVRALIPAHDPNEISRDANGALRTKKSKMVSVIGTKSGTSRDPYAGWKEDVFALDVARKRIVEAVPGNLRVQDSRASEYEAYIAKLCSYKKKYEASCENSDSDPTWRGFSWGKTTLNSIEFEISASAFNRATFKLAAFKRWITTTAKSEKIRFDGASLTSRIRDAYASSSSSSSSCSFANDRAYYKPADASYNDELASHSKSLKEASGIFEWLASCGFPDRGNWADEFVGVFDVKTCEDFGQLCLHWSSMLIQITASLSLKTGEEKGTLSHPSGSASNDFLKSTYLLYLWWVSLQDYKDAFAGTKRSTSADAPNAGTIKCVRSCWTMLERIGLLCYVRYEFDKARLENRTATNSAELLGIYRALQVYDASKPAVAGRYAADVVECRDILHSHNSNISRDPVPSYTMGELLSSRLAFVTTQMEAKHKSLTRDKFSQKRLPFSPFVDAPSERCIANATTRESKGAGNDKDDDRDVVVADTGYFNDEIAKEIGAFAASQFASNEVGIAVLTSFVRAKGYRFASSLNETELANALVQRFVNDSRSEDDEGEGDEDCDNNDADSQ